MIQGKIRKQGNSFVVTIPRDEMEHYHLTEGDEIAFTPTKKETRYVLRPVVQEAVDRVLRDHQEGLKYLADN
jgi:putative addiction module antidote